ncbi:hypothetical protein BRO54_3323 [Geobacillus proteiniphilus]|uniref:Uncharacterized protein n=1 Tax=Geobacillus proteiniphilus TaxID=860353 RepID=A0A1Q5SNB0_9BACL|nr:hypothetical protein BRO54_3323 [Geobacillus proteiniphilus]
MSLTPSGNNLIPSRHSRVACFIPFQPHQHAQKLFFQLNSLTFSIHHFAKEGKLYLFATADVISPVLFAQFLVVPLMMPANLKAQTTRYMFFNFFDCIFRRISCFPPHDLC